MAADLVAMEVRSSTVTGAQVPRIWERETMQPNQPKQTKMSPGSLFRACIQIQIEGVGQFEIHRV